MTRKGGPTAALKERSGSKPFERFSWELWGYLRLNKDRNQLDSERWTNQIQVRMENELCFVVEPLKREIERLNAELEKAKSRAKKANHQLRANKQQAMRATLESHGVQL